VRRDASAGGAVAERGADLSLRLLRLELHPGVVSEGCTTLGCPDSPLQRKHAPVPTQTHHWS